MLTAYDFARGEGRAVAFDVMLKDRDAIRLYESLGCKLLGQITHHHSDGLEEPALVFVAPKRLDDHRHSFGGRPSSL
jgi:ribosomal protein S18 acetylase RimI-like enzyme